MQPNPPVLTLFVLLLAACSQPGPAGKDPAQLSPKSESSVSIPPTPSPRNDRPVVLILGNSLTAGYGLEDPALAYPAILQTKLDQAGLALDVVNAGISGDTSAGGLRRVDWYLGREIRVLLLELGANDGLRGLALSATASNLQTIVELVRSRYPRAGILIAGMMVPPNLGREYSSGFQNIFRKTAETNGGVLIPFLLEGVAGIPSLNQSDGIHPTPEGHRIMAETVWKALAPMLEAKNQ